MRVKLSPYTIDRICMEAACVAENNFGQVEMLPRYTSREVADAIYALVMPPEKEAAVTALLPEGYRAIAYDGAVTITSEDVTEDTISRVSMSTSIEYSTPRLKLYGAGHIRDLPGIEHLYWKHHNVVIKPKDGGKDIQNAHLREFVQSCAVIRSRLDERKARATQTANDIRAVLSKYNSLNKAIKVEGPWLTEFLPLDILNLYNEQPTPRKKPTPSATVEVDTTNLIAQAGIKTLGLGGGFFADD